MNQVRIPNAHDRLYVCSVEQDIRHLDTETRELSGVYLSDIDTRRSKEWVTNCRLHIVLTAGLVEERFGNDPSVETRPA